MDEITSGTASYFISETGHDEHGKLLPLSFEGMGDFKPPVDIYLKALVVKVFGLNEFSVRIVGAVIGALTIVVLVFLLRELGLTPLASLFGGLWLAFSGWHIFYSRAVYEAVTALFFLTLGSWFFTKNKYSLAVIAFCLAAWSYHAEKLFVPLYFLLLVWVYKDKLQKYFQDRKKLLLPALILAMFAGPFGYSLLTNHGVSARASELGLRENDSLITQYLNYFDLRFWFWKAIYLTPPGFADIGLTYAIDLPFFLAGVYALLKSKNRVLKKIVLGIFLLGPIPATFARGEPSAIRILVWVPFWTIIISMGFEYLYKKWGKRLVLVYGICLVLSVTYFFDLYTHNFDKYYADLWHYGYKEVAIYFCENHEKYKKVVITDKYGIELPNIKTIPHYYLLFYCKIDPANYLVDHKIYNVEIRQPQWRIDRKEKGVLLIGSRWDFPEGFPEDKIIKTIKFPNGKDAFYMVETDGYNEETKM